MYCSYRVRRKKTMSLTCALLECKSYLSLTTCTHWGTDSDVSWCAAILLLWGYDQQSNWTI
jgi:hypothetical protein